MARRRRHHRRHHSRRHRGLFGLGEGESVKVTSPSFLVGFLAGGAATFFFLNYQVNIGAGGGALPAYGGGYYGP